MSSVVRISTSAHRNAAVHDGHVAQTLPSLRLLRPELKSAASRPGCHSVESISGRPRGDRLPRAGAAFPSVRRGHRAVGPRHDGSSLLASRVVCDDDAGRPEQAAESRRQSAAWFQRCKPFSGDEEGASMGAVLVDVLRRCGEFGEASAECQATMASPGATGVIRQVLEYQQQLIDGGDTLAHELSECE